MKIFLWFMMSILAIIAFWYGWPTPFETIEYKNELYRIHRLKGFVQKFEPSGWKEMPSKETISTSKKVAKN